MIEKYATSNSPWRGSIPYRTARFTAEVKHKYREVPVQRFRTHNIHGNTAKRVGKLLNVYEQPRRIQTTSKRTVCNQRSMT